MNEISFIELYPPLFNLQLTSFYFSCTQRLLEYSYCLLLNIFIICFYLCLFNLIRWCYAICLPRFWLFCVLFVYLWFGFLILLFVYICDLVFLLLLVFFCFAGTACHFPHNTSGAQRNLKIHLCRLDSKSTKPTFIQMQKYTANNL